MKTITNENMVTVQLSIEAFGFTGLNKQEIEAAILTSIQCQLSFTTNKGEKIELISYDVPQVENITVEDEDGNEITLSDELFY